MIEIAGLAIIPIIWGMSQVIKKVGLPGKYIPFVAVIIGLAFMLIANGITIEAILLGIVAGLGASGLHEVGSKIVEQ